MTFKAIIRIMSGFSLIVMFGCATPALMDVGRHKEEAVKYNKAKMTKDAIVIGYEVRAKGDRLHFWKKRACLNA